MRAVVKKWGNSASVRIPASIMSAIGLRLNQPVDVREDHGRIIIEPVEDDNINLAELVSGITAENMHEGVDLGEPVGKEAI